MKLGVNKRLRGKKLYAEAWRDIEGYEGLYQVSNIGRVRSLDREVWNGNGWYTKKGQIMTPCKDRNGYLMVLLSKNGKTKRCLVHRLVAKAFIPNPENKPQIDHINTIRTKNEVWNLRWVTPKENNNNEITLKHFGEAQKGKTFSEETRKKISEAKWKKIICIETGQVFKSVKEAGEIIGVFPTNISACCKGKRKTASGFHWKYYEDYLREVS